jgi:hypothetical protein
MQDGSLSRRQVLVLGGGAVGLAAASGASPGHALDLTRPADNLTAWMKMRASLVSQDVYFWFTGTLDLAVPGEPIRPLVTVETLILRRTAPQGGQRFHVTDWEASFYRDPVTGAVAEKITNPVTGQVVAPMPYREGPVTFEYTVDHEPKLVGLATPFPSKPAPFIQPWRVVGNDVWMTKYTYIFGRPQWLDIKEFPEETPATPISVSATAIMQTTRDLLEDPAVSSTRTSYFYQATSDWLPWMKMGQRPGFVVWREAGKKLFSLDEVPADSLATLRRLHPVWFNRPVPWEGFTNLFLMYKDSRKQ